MYTNTHASRSSVNMTDGDMANARHSQAREAGEILYNNLRSDSFNSSNNTNNSRNYGAISYDELPENDKICCGPMSPVRRTFCLIILFDLIGSFIFYVIYTRVSNFSLQNYKDEILHYTFESSLFDAVLCSACRFVPLLLAYALLRLSHPWPVAVTTFITCSYVIAKVFVFKWTPSKSEHDVVDHNNVICYALLIVSFVITWIEVWFLDFQVLPREYKAKKRASYYTDTSHLVDSADHQIYNDHDMFASLPDSREGSDDESHSAFHSVANSRHHTRPHSKASSGAVSLGGEEQEYQEKAREAWDQAWDILQDTTGWVLEKGTSLEEGKIFVKTYPNIGKLFKLEAYVNCSPQHLFNELVIKVEHTPKWNSTVVESKKLQVIDDTTDIQYAVAAEAAGGMVASRDFVNLRHWKSRNGITLASACAVEHRDAPESKKYVRGENRPGGWVFKQVPGKPHQCHFIWIMNTDIKGWIPQWTVDQALSGTIMNFLKSLRLRMQKTNPHHSTI